MNLVASKLAANELENNWLELGSAGQLTLLDGSNEQIPFCVVLAQRGIVRLKARSSVPIGIPVKLDSKDQMILGEVVLCVRDGDEYLVAIEADQVFAPSLQLVELLHKIRDREP